MANVWSQPSPWQWGTGGHAFKSRTKDLWDDWGTRDVDDPDLWWNTLNQWADPKTNSWQSLLGEQMFDQDIYSFVEQGYDPFPRSFQNPYSPQSGTTWQRVDYDIMSYLMREFPELMGFSHTAGSVAANSTANIGGDWENVDQWNAEIVDAISKVFDELGVHVPGNVVKAIMMIESQGIMPNGPNDSGAGGLMQVTPGAYGADKYDFNLVNSDPGYSIWAGVYDLALRYLDAKRINPDYNWSNVASGYFSGHYEPNGAADSYGTTDHLYMQRFTEYYAELNDAVIGGAEVPIGDGSVRNNGGPEFWAVTGGIVFPVTQEHGPTEWSQGAGSYMYTYAPYLGIEGHFGVDVGTPMGTQLFSPVDGIVLEQFDSTSYQSTSVGGSMNGGLYIQRPNGDIVILGHMYRIDVPPGTQIRAGQAVGLSGSLNGDHVHVEYRRKQHHRTWNPYTGSYVEGDYVSIDPRLALNGIFTGTYSGGVIGGGESSQYAAPVDNWAALMRATSTGAPIDTWSNRAINTFHDWMREGARNQWRFGSSNPSSPGANTIAGSWGVSFGQSSSDTWETLAKTYEQQG